MDIESSFEAQIERITVVTEKETQEELAEFFGDSPASVAHIFQCGKLPYRWLVILTQCKRVNPEWVLTGTGPAFFPSHSPGVRYETVEEAVERQDDEKALCRLSSRMLADELVRRTAIVEKLKRTQDVQMDEAEGVETEDSRS